jgi:hypothetical protein
MLPVMAGLTRPLVLVFMLMACVAHGQAPLADPPGHQANATVRAQLRWKSLRYGASKLFLSASTTISVTVKPGEEIVADLRAPVEGDPRPTPQGEVAVIGNDTDLPFGKREVATVWVDATNFAVLQEHKVVTGKDPYEKIFRYTTDGLFMWRSSPTSDAERKLAPERWSKRRQRHVVTTPALPAGAVVTDSYALIYLASAARLDRAGSHLTAYLQQDDKLVELTFTARGLRQTPCDVKLLGPGGRTTQSRVMARVVNLTGRILGEEAGRPRSDVDLGLLGLRGSLTMLIEHGTGIPFEIHGDTDGFGTLTVSLERVELAR